MEEKPPLRRDEKIGAMIMAAIVFVAIGVGVFCWGVSCGKDQAFRHVNNKMQQCLFDAGCWKYELNERSGKIEIADLSYDQPCWKRIDHLTFMRLKNTMHDSTSIYY